MKITADNITDEQIREVLMLDEPEDAFAVALLAATGNAYTMPPSKATAEQRHEARVRCAEILNTHNTFASPLLQQLAIIVSFVQMDSNGEVVIDLERLAHEPGEASAAANELIGLLAERALPSNPRRAQDIREVDWTVLSACLRERYPQATWIELRPWDGRKFRRVWSR